MCFPCSTNTFEITGHENQPTTVVQKATAAILNLHFVLETANALVVRLVLKPEESIAITGTGDGFLFRVIHRRRSLNHGSSRTSSWARTNAPSLRGHQSCPEDRHAQLKVVPLVRV